MLHSHCLSAQAECGCWLTGSLSLNLMMIFMMNTLGVLALIDFGLDSILLNRFLHLYMNPRLFVFLCCPFLFNIKQLNSHYCFSFLIATVLGLVSAKSVAFRLCESAIFKSDKIKYSTEAWLAWSKSATHQWITEKRSAASHGAVISEILNLKLIAHTIFLTRSTLSAKLIDFICCSSVFHFSSKQHVNVKLLSNQLDSPRCWTPTKHIAYLQQKNWNHLINTII